uniref:Uncharacterized protein n=1 Tax=Panagrolaimus sp. ES5 TaxID=591445 RepID=A0AC34FEW8_9BILA
MEQVILSVEFNNGHLNVWQESRHGYNRFYVTPLSILETDSIKCVKDTYANVERFAVTFNIKLWDLKAAEKVKTALDQKNIVAKISDILPLPMFKLRLGIGNGLSEKISVPNEWRSNQDQPNSMAFEIYIKDEELCQQMANDAKLNSESFLARTKLFLEFKIAVGQSNYQNLNISGSTFAKSKFFNLLENAYADKNEIFDAIKGPTIYSNSLTENEWNFVFWGDIFERPDIQADYFNHVIKYNESEGLFKFNETKDYEYINKYPLEKGHQVGYYFKGFGLKNCEIFKESINKESIKKFLQQDNINVEWSGTKFIPKNFEIFRLNLKSLKSSSGILFKRFLTTTESTQKIEIRSEAQNPIIIPPSIGCGTYQNNNNRTHESEKEKYENEVKAFIINYGKNAPIPRGLFIKINDLQQQLKNITKEVEAKISNVETRLTDWNFKQIQKMNQNFLSINQGEIENMILINFLKT